MSPIRVVAAALVGGIIMFAWGAIAHMMTPLGEMGISTVGTAEEKEFQAALKAAFGREGLYYVPGAPMRDDMDGPAVEAWAKASENEPTAFVVYTPRMGEMMPPSNLVNEAVSNGVAALLVAIILGMTSVGYVGRVFITVLIGVSGWLSISVSYWIWYHFPVDFVLAEGAMQAIGWLASGIFMAGIVGGKTATVTAPG
jgi:hypothetical protein